MKFQRLVKIITKNMALLSIILAFVLGVVGMTGLRSKFFDTSKWFMSEEEVHEKFGDDDDKKVQDEQHQTDENGNLITPEQGQSDNTNDSDVSDASGKSAVSNSDASTEVNNSSETVLLSETENTNLSVISQTSQDGESESSSQFTETDKEMTSSTKITSATTKEQKETKASSTSRTTETEAPSDTTTTTVATTEETTNTTAAPETTTTTTAVPTTAATTEATTVVETTTEATTSKSSSNSLGDTSGSYDKDMARQILDLVNAERAASGLPALSWSDTLASDAAIRATELPINWSHTRPDGSKWWTAGSQTSMGENLAMGQTSPSQTVSDWMQSQKHKDNILDANYKRLGVACYYCGGTYYWVQEFGY